MTKSLRYFLWLTLVSVAICLVGCGPRPGSPELPLQYIGPDLPDPEAPDGRLMFSPGVQNIQINRANRKHPPSFPSDPENYLGWTYQHHIGIGCWKGRLYAVWDMSHKGEDSTPCHLVYSTSSDGFSWSEPKDLFPYGLAYNLRFYFYRASNGRMLTFGCGAYPTDNISESKKDTLLVREITADHRLGKVYTLIKPGPKRPPFYEQCKDAGFVAACREAYNNRLLLEQQDYGVFLDERRMKWHDEKNWPGGEVPSVGGDLWVWGKSLCFFHRKDGTVVGLCKMGWVTQSTDGGKTWSLPVMCKGIVGGSGKLWAQKTPDGHYAMIYIPQRRHRYPMAVTTSEDGITFRDMRVIHGEVPPQRYAGRAKNMGPQYLRGVAEWGGDAPSIDKSASWVIYSVNKEDIWVSRIPVPIVSETQQPVHDTFDNTPPGPRVPGWNTYSPLWAPVRIAAKPGSANHYLQLKDCEPSDYARAIRTFPPSTAADVSFRLAAGQADLGRLEIDLLGERGTRPVRLALNDHGQIQCIEGQQEEQSKPPKKSLPPGLAGIYFNSADFQRPDNSIDFLFNLDQYWGSTRGVDWSGRWTGFIAGPYNGQVIFTAEATDGLRLKIGQKVVIDGLAKGGARSGKVTMKKGKQTPITLEFTSAEGKAALRLFWSWPGQARTIVPAAALSHNQRIIKSIIPKDAGVFDYNPRFLKKIPEEKAIDLMPYKADVWLNFKIHADCTTGKYSLAINGQEVLKDAKFAEPSSMVYALSFRTGKYRGASSTSARDLPNTEEPSPLVVYRIDEVTTANLRRTK